MNYWTKKMCKAFVFDMAPNKNIPIPQIIYEETMVHYFQSEAMDEEYAKNKAFKIDRFGKTAETIDDRIRLTEQNDILCNNYVNAENDEDQVHEWLFYIRKVPKGKEDGLYFKLALEETQFTDFKWWPANQAEHRYKHFKPYDTIKITIDWRNYECWAFLHINGILDGPQYELTSEVSSYNYHTQFTAGWGSRDPGVQIELINFQSHIFYE